MSLIQALRGNFSRMVDAHETGGMLALRVAEIGVGDVGGRILARGLAGGGGYGAQRIVGTGKQAVERRQVSILHTADYSNAPQTNGILRGRWLSGD